MFNVFLVIDGDDTNVMHGMLCDDLQLRRLRLDLCAKSAVLNCSSIEDRLVLALRRLFLRDRSAVPRECDCWSQRDMEVSWHLMH
jgi:hypothetical protein